MQPRNTLEWIIEWLLIRFAGGFTLILLFCIFAFILIEGIPFLADYEFGNFMFKTDWYPLSERYGSLPLLYGSLLITLIATAIAIPLSVGLAIFISELCPKRMAEFLKVSVEILASIPSVVFGFIGILIVGPGLRAAFGLTHDLNAFTGGLLLAFMALPTITSVAEESMQAVPKVLREASFALGATKLQTIFKVTIPAASSGIFAGTMLGIGRVVGETMTVMMVAGGSALIDWDVFGPVRTLTGTIAAEMGEVVEGDTHYRALFMLGLILFVFTFILNSVSSKVVRRIRRKQLGGA